MYVVVRIKKKKTIGNILFYLAKGIRTLKGLINVTDNFTVAIKLIGNYMMIHILFI